MINKKPLISYVIFAYNQEKYISEAVKSAFAQTYEPLEIIISDDFSNDGTFQIISELVEKYRGRHKVVARRNLSNLGFTEHISKIMEIVNGEFIISADGDDISYPNRTEKVVSKWLNNNKKSGVIFSYYDTLSENGLKKINKDKGETLEYNLINIPNDVMKSICVGMLGCTITWSKDIFQIFGDLDKRSIHQDITIPLRSILIGSITIIQEQLVIYRLIDGSLSRISASDRHVRSLKMKKYCDSRIANYEQFEKDIETAIQKKLIKRNETNSIRNNVKNEMEIAQLNSQFFSSNFYIRLKLIFLSSNKVPIRRKLKLLLLTFIPFLYSFNR